MDERKELVETLRVSEGKKQDAIGASLNLQALTATLLTKVITNLCEPDDIEDPRKMREDIGNLQTQLGALTESVMEIKEGLQTILQHVQQFQQ